MIPAASDLYAAIKENTRDYRSEDHRIRLWRAASWIDRAQREGTDDDEAFIFLWIAFNALYAMERSPEEGSASERAAFQAFLQEIVRHDTNKRLRSMMMLNMTGKIIPLLDSRYILHRFWQSVKDPDTFPDWESVLHRSRDKAKYAYSEGDEATTLNILFDRLYVLRNQMIHGGATYGSQLNREMVEKAAAVLRELIPVITDILVRNPNLDLGPVIFPVIKEES